MKEIKNITINTDAMTSAKTFRTFTVVGDPGAMFTVTVTNEDNHFYNFSEEKNKNGELKTSLAFAATPASLKPKTIDSSGVYTGGIEFPAITDDDHYVITLYSVGDSSLSNSLSDSNVYILDRIYKYVDTTVTFSLSSAGSSGSYNSMPSNVTFVGPSSSSPISLSQQQTKTIKWDISLSTSQFVIARQPIIEDFQFTTTKTTSSSSDTTGETNYIELTDITGISVGMGVSGTGIASNSVVRKVIKGFKNYNKSSDLQDYYEVPKTTTTNLQNETVISDSTAGTIIISNSSTWNSGITLTFTGKGSASSEVFNNTKYSVKNLALTIDPVVTTTDAAVSNSTTIPITSTDGIKASESVLMTGIGVTAASPHVDAISAGVNITASSAQTIEDGQTVTFTGSSRNATITADVTVLEHGTDNITLTLALDNILTVG
jgi:hypothetical protein